MTDTAMTTSVVSPSVAAAMETYERLATVRNVLAPDLNDQELQLFAMVAQRSGLDPFAKQIYAVKRAGRVTFQTGIDGLRSTAERTHEYAGSEEPEFGPDKDGHPEWARVTVYRLKNGVRFGQPATAYWSEFHPGGNQPMWQKMPRNQLAKCAEALALRKAFPYVLSDVYASEEMDQAGPAEDAALVAAAAQPTTRERLAARRQAREAARTDEPEAEIEVEGEASEGLTRAELLERLADLNVPAPYAMEVARRAINGFDGTRQLTPGERLLLVAFIENEQADIAQAAEAAL